MKNGLRILANFFSPRSSMSAEIKKEEIVEEFEPTPILVAVCAYLTYGVIFIIGCIRELIFGPGPVGKIYYGAVDRFGYVPLQANYEGFYIRNIYRRLKMIFNNPICSTPGAEVIVRNRFTDDHSWTVQLIPSSFPESSSKMINLASYNYLGYAQNKGPVIDSVFDEIRHSGVANASPTAEYGSTKTIKQLESLVADFMGTEASIVFGMGFATNSLNLPSLISKGCLVLSDEKNHASIILGLRLSGAMVRIFDHNNMEDLEKLLRQAIIKGQPRTHRPWRKIIIVVEGVYSMEGSIAKLPKIIDLKKKYGAYVYLDEAHSVGAMGPRGRGIVDYFGLNPQDVDILMGTFTKSFAAAGGYIAGSKDLISYLRIESHASNYACSMAPAVARQIITSMRSIMTEGDCVHQLAQNTQYFRRKLKAMGFIVYGNKDSPVVPMMLFTPSKTKAFVMEMRHRKIAVIAVGFPVTPITCERVRFCLSAGHTRDMLDTTLRAIGEVGNKLNLKIKQSYALE